MKLHLAGSAVVFALGFAAACGSSDKHRSPAPLTDGGADAQSTDGGAGGAKPERDGGRGGAGGATGGAAGSSGAGGTGGAKMDASAPADASSATDAGTPDSGRPVLGEYCVFADPNLEDDVRRALPDYVDGGVPTGPIPVALASRIASLDLWCDCSDTLDLSGIECLTGLESLGFGGDYLNIDRLQWLPNLKTLTVEYQGSVLPDAFELLTQVEVVDLHQGNSIDDLSAFANFANLRELYLQNNAVSDLSQLASLTKLEKLDIQGNQVTDLGPLSGLTHLTYLHASNNALTSIAPLSGLTALTELQISNMTIGDITPVTNLANLTAFYAEGDTFTSIAPLQGLTKLDFVAISGTPGIKDFSPLVNNTGFGSGDTLYASPDSADCASFKADAATLSGRGVLMYGFPNCP
ncbi:MAG TPA: leucine-rich repeat domain-containing protein [Polyangiaceae bacterium]|nr:leucine-rich repeat domain-containing protein [Polyangiaceae bacterium]